MTWRAERSEPTEQTEETWIDLEGHRETRADFLLRWVYNLRLRLKEPSEGEIMAKKLYRSLSNKMIGGVCAGVAQYFDLDVSLVRLLFVAAALLTALFPMFVLYIVAWIIIPVKEEVKSARNGNNKAKAVKSKK
jgi:phage shock protein C